MQGKSCGRRNHHNDDDDCHNLRAEPAKQFLVRHIVLGDRIVVFVRLLLRFHSRREARRAAHRSVGSENLRLFVLQGAS